MTELKPLRMGKCIEDLSKHYSIPDMKHLRVKKFVVFFSLSLLKSENSPFNVNFNFVSFFISLPQQQQFMSYRSEDL